MAGDWIPWSKGLAKKPEILAISRITHRPRREVAAILCEFWEWADAETDSGTLKGVTLEQLEEIIPGTTGPFWLAVVQAGWLGIEGADLRIPNFSRWLGRSAKRRLKDTERKRNVRNLSASHADKNGTTGQDSTEGDESPLTPLAPRSADADAGQMDPDPVILTFPTVGKVAQWHLRQSKLHEYAESFPALDVLAEARRALQWARDNPRNRKTARGMTAFLGRWLGRAQDDPSRRPRNGREQPELFSGIRDFINGGPPGEP